MKIIGLTGGIGSGKTTIANYFASLGVPVYIADNAAKSMLDQDEIKKLLIQEFGSEVIIDGKVDRARLAQIVFNDAAKLAKLNSIVHPAVAEDFRKWLTKQDFPFVIREAAILFESGSYKDCDAIITVVAPMELRIERTIKRDNSSREEILRRINSQWTDDMRIANSDYIIVNENLEDSYRQSRDIYNKIINK